MKDYYEEINKTVITYEEHKPYHPHTLSWAADRVNWCWRWRKITKPQMEELADRITILFEER